MLITLLGWVCAVVGAIIGFPQLSRLLRSGTSAGVSLVSWQLLTASASAWVVHGTRLHAWPVGAANLVMAVSGLLIVRMTCRDRGRRLPPVLAVPVAVLAVLVVVDFVFGPTIFGIGCNLPQIVALLAQARDIVRLPDITGLSGSYLALTVATQVLWGTWAVLAHERAVIAAAISLGSVALITLATFGARRVGLITPRTSAAGPSASS